MKCAHEAWEESASSRKCADCGQWLEPTPKPAADFQVGDRVSVEGVITYINERGTAAEVEGASGGRSDIVMADLTLVERPKRKLRVGSVWECAKPPNRRFVVITQGQLMPIDGDSGKAWPRDEVSIDEAPELWREVPVEELEAEALR